MKQYRKPSPAPESEGIKIGDDRISDRAWSTAIGILVGAGVTLTIQAVIKLVSMAC